MTDFIQARIFGQGPNVSHTAKNLNDFDGYQRNESIQVYSRAVYST